MNYFISDLHLGLGSTESYKCREKLLLRFIDKIRPNCDKLFIVGDLFDYWFEYKTVIPRPFFRTLTALDGLKNQGAEIIYLMGNHDFGHKDFFETELSIPIIPDDYECELSGKKFYISHGDGKSNNDLGYRVLKRILRNPAAKKLYSWIHPDVGISIASGSSHKSRKYTEDKDYGEIDGMKQFAEMKISEGYDFVVMGHRHKAEFTELGGGVYINLGTWLKEPYYGIFDGSRFELLKVSGLLGESEG